MQVMIKKGKCNLEIKSQLTVIQLNSKDAVGNFCTVKILNTPSVSPIVPQHS